MRIKTISPFLLLLCVAFALPCADSCAQSIKFTHLLHDDGIPNGGVRAVVADQRGFIWLATDNGLRRYDGYEMRAIDVLAGANGIAVNALAIDQTGALIYATDQGIYRMKTDSIAQRGLILGIGTGPVRAISSSLDGSKIRISGPQMLAEIDATTGRSTVIAEDLNVTASCWDPRSNSFVLGTRTGSVLRTIEGGGVREVFHCRTRVNDLLFDTAGNLWIATDGTGVVVLKDDQPLRHLQHVIGSNSGLPSNLATCLRQDSKGDMWIGTKNGLSRCAEASQAIVTYRHDADDSRSLPTNEVGCLFEDHRGVLWVGHSRGVSRFPLAAHNFSLTRHREGDSTSLSNDSVYGMVSDKQGRLWIGTEDGLNLRLPDGRMRRYTFPDPQEKQAEAKFIYVAHATPDGRLWLGTRGFGLVIFDPSTEAYEIKRHHADSSGEDLLPSNSITAITAGPPGQIWVGTTGGIQVFDESGNGTARYLHDAEDSGSLAEDAVSDILVARSGEILVATEHFGVQPFDAATGKFSAPIEHVRGRVSALFQSSDGRILVTTLGSGVHFLNTADAGYVWLKTLDSANSKLPSDVVFGTVEDRLGGFWFTTEQGLTRMDGGTSNFRIFDIDDGIQAMTFNPKAYLARDDGELYFGGPQGFNMIDPAGLPEARTTRQALLTGLEINGEPIDPGPDNEYLKRPLALTEVLRLRYEKSRRLEFRFGTLDYTYPSNNRFRYRLDPIDNDWVYSEKANRAPYGTLPVGSYTFEVQSSVDGQSWNHNSASIRVRVLPLWHQTWLARGGIIALILLTFTALGFIFYRRQALKIRRESEILEIERNRAEAALATQLQRAMLVERTSYGQQAAGDSSSTFALTLDRLREHFGADACVLCDYREGPPRSFNLIAEHTPGMDPRFTMANVSPHNDVIRRVLSQQQAVASGDIAGDSAFTAEAALLLKFDIRSMVAVKTSFQGATNGILFIFHRKTFPWSEEDINLVESVADQISVNIAHQRLTLADERQRTELDAARKAAEVANQAKSDFLAKMSHELRTPLSSILGFSELLADDPAITPSQRSTLDIINNSGEHLLQTINDILDMSKIESGAVEITTKEFNLHGMLTGVTEMLRSRADTRNLKLEVDCADDVPAWILADKTKLRQILVNLVGNSLKFTESGGITIRATNVTQSGGVADADERRLQFEIIDTGSGISDEQIGKLFGKFSQTDSGRKSGQGTGLGLAISKNFVELMGGQISVHSKLGVGTVFAFDICCNEVAAAASAPAELGAAPPAKFGRLTEGHEEIRVLIAEDQLPNRLLLKTILKQRGFKVIEAENGQEAIAAWIESKPHIIFMDNEMPVMDGMTAAREINKQAAGGERPCIVSCTAYALDTFREVAMDAGCVDFLAKPYQQDELFELIARHVPVEYERIGA